MTGLKIIKCDLNTVLPFRSAWAYNGLKTPEDSVVSSDCLEGHHWVAYVNSVPAGAASLYPDSQTVDGREVLYRLRGLCVNPLFRRQGVASSLVETRLEYVRFLGEKLVYSSIRSYTISLHEKLGAVTIGEPYTLPTIGEHFTVLYKL